MIERISSQKSFSEEDLDKAIEILQEANRLRDNSEVMKMIDDYAKKKAGQIRSIADLRSAVDNMFIDDDSESKGEDNETDAEDNAKAKKED